MSGLSFVLVLFEITVVVGIVWAILNEQFFIEIENRLLERIAAAFKRRHNTKKAQQVETQQVKPNPVAVTQDDEFSRFSPFVA